MNAWLTQAEAAAVVGVSADHFRRLARRAGLTSTPDRSPRYAAAEVVNLAAERRGWVSWAAAAELAGCSQGRIGAAVRAGLIETRPQQPSLCRASVEAYARGVAQERAARAARRAEKQPPDEEHVWLDKETVALLLGVTPRWVADLTRRDRLPHTRNGTRVWWRRDLIEPIAAARAYRKPKR